MTHEQVNIRYMVNDVQASVDWYVTHLGFEQISNAAPAFADVKRGALRLLLSGEKSSAGRPLSAALFDFRETAAQDGAGRGPFQQVAQGGALAKLSSQGLDWLFYRLLKMGCNSRGQNAGRTLIASN